jgi:hypothetical protein
MSRSSLSQFPARFPARWQSIFLTRIALLRVEKMVLILVLRTNSGANPNSLWLTVLRGVLDGCSQACNQRPHQNFLIL